MKLIDIDEFNARKDINNYSDEFGVGYVNGFNDAVCEIKACVPEIKPSSELYAVRDKNTGKLVSNITNPSRKYWTRKGNAISAIENYKSRYGAYDNRELELVTFKLIEVLGCE